MTVLLVAAPTDVEDPSREPMSVGGVIEVSQLVGERLSLKLGGLRSGILTARHLPRLRKMAADRERDSDLSLVVRAIEVYGEAHVRLL